MKILLSIPEQTEYEIKSYAMIMDWVRWMVRYKPLQEGSRIVAA